MKPMREATSILPLAAVGLGFSPGGKPLLDDLNFAIPRSGLTGYRAVPTLLWDGRFALATAILAGFGRASAEVGAVLIVGGNIAGYTRTMTTTITLETSKGDLPLALGLGIVLIALTLAINAVAFGASRIGARYAG